MRELDSFKNKNLNKTFRSLEYVNIRSILRYIDRYYILIRFCLLSFIN